MNKRRLIGAEYRMNIQDPIICGLLNLVRKKFNIDFQMHEVPIIGRLLNLARKKFNIDFQMHEVPFVEGVYGYWFFSPVIDQPGWFYIHQFPKDSVPVEFTGKARMANFLIALLILDEFKPLPENEVLQLAQQKLKSPDACQG